MADHVLYFPSIRVPSGDWFSRVLLYWDSVATIVPLEVLEKPDVLGLHTRELIDQKLIVAVQPDAEVWAGGAGNYYQAFLELVEQAGLGREQPLEANTGVRVHLDKTGTGLASELERRGLARYDEGAEYASWFEVEPQTADLLMAFLATLIARGRDSTVPLSDRRESLAAFRHLRQGGERSTADLVNDHDSVRTYLLAGVLPAPSAIRAAQMAEFKERHRTQLVRMRNRVEQEILRVSALPTPAARDEQLRLSAYALQDETREIQARMKEAGWRSLTTSTILGVVAGGLCLADASITGGKLTLAGASLGLVGAAWGAFDGAQPKQEWLERPMAYAALAGQALE